MGEIFEALFFGLFAPFAGPTFRTTSLLSSHIHNTELATPAQSSQSTTLMGTVENAC
jgi:hypothetical protein